MSKQAKVPPMPSARAVDLSKLKEGGAPQLPPPAETVMHNVVMSLNFMAGRDEDNEVQVEMIFRTPFAEHVIPMRLNGFEALERGVAQVRAALDGAEKLDDADLITEVTEEASSQAE